jgi:hypothetical protein
LSSGKKDAISAKGSELMFGIALTFAIRVPNGVAIFVYSGFLDLPLLSTLSALLGSD